MNYGGEDESTCPVDCADVDDGVIDETDKSSPSSSGSSDSPSPVVSGKLNDLPPNVLFESTNCEGCMVDGKCFSIGVRKNGRYCGTNGYVFEYKEGETSCENNFECASNICADSVCVEPKLFRRFLLWLERL